VHLHFYRSPAEILCREGRVCGLRVEHTELVARDGRLRAEGTSRFSELSCGLVLRSIGYRSDPLEDVPFDERRGVLPSVDGRLATPAGDVVAGEYVSGWARRGASGVIGTNKEDAREVIGHLLDDLGALEPATHPEPEAIDALLEAKGVRRVDASDWEALRRSERRRGSWHGRRAIKYERVDEMLAALDERR
jgi:ferredoxin--NADP+ reductase